MKLQFPFIQLPLTFDADALANEVAAIGEAAWRPHPQGFPGNSMLPLVAVNGDPADESFMGPMQPTPHLARCPYLQQTIAAIGAVVGRTRLMRLSGRAEVTEHADAHYYWVEHMRVHVPIVTQPSVRFQCGGFEVNMAPGECWIFDTWRQHRVLNDHDDQRIHLVMDTVGGEHFWRHTAAGRPHPAPAPMPDWRPQRIEKQSRATDLQLETANLPVVMTPWELNTHLNFLLSEMRPAPELQNVRMIAAQFARQWRSMWAHYGDRPEGRPHFRHALQAFLNAVHPHAEPLTLPNGVPLDAAISAMIGLAAVAPESNTPSPASILADIR